MSYVPDPTVLTEPTDLQSASTGAAEFRALKAYIASVLGSIPNKANISGDNATGTWPISITGAAASASAVLWAGVSGRPTLLSQFTNDIGAGGGGGGAVASVNGRIGAIVINQSDVTAALGYSPYGASNPSGYISGISGAMVVSALGYTPYSNTNPNGYISGISAPTINSALGFAVGTNAQGTKTISTAGPSGGVDGDVWYQY